MLVVIAGYSLCAVQTTAFAASAKTIDLNGLVENEKLAGAIETYLDPTTKLTMEDILKSKVDEFELLESSVIDFGYTKSHIWARVRLHNTHPTSRDWNVHFHENFKQIFEVYIERQDGRVQSVLKLDQESTFYDRTVLDPQLVAPFNMKAGESVTMYIHLWSEGSSNLAMSFNTQLGFMSEQTTRIAKNFAFYGMMLLLIAVAIVALAIFRHVVFLAYIAYSLSAFLYIMHSDGVAFQFLWPNWPALNNYASVLTGAGIITFAAYYARVFLETPRFHPKLNIALWVVMIVHVLLIAATFFFDNQPIKKLMVLVGMFGLSVCLIGGFIAARHRFKQVRFYIVAWISVVASAAVMTMRHWFGLEISQSFQYDTMRMVLVFDAAMLGLAIADQYVQLRQSRQRALKLRLEEANRNLTLSNRLHELESQYKELITTVKSKDEEIRNTIHDLSQPIGALRLNVENLAKGEKLGNVNSSDINAMFSYLESLISGYLKGEGAPEARANNTTGPGLLEVMENVRAMFAEEAESRGLRLTTELVEAGTTLRPLPLMRIVSNLMSNAIRYTERGAVSLAVRMRGENVLIEVADTGRGLDAEEFEKALQREVRLEDESKAEGSGYGLSIAAQLAKENDCRLYLDANYSGGTKIVLQAPAAA